MRRTWAFTLVELLVVMGITSLLIGILLPVVSSARRQAGAVKCASQLREIYNAYQMYAIDSKGWYPPSLLAPAKSAHYNVDGIDYPLPAGEGGAYWFNFLAKYVTNVNGAKSVADGADDHAPQRNTVFWGCPSWDGYPDDGPGGVHPSHVGYGATYWVHVTPTSPAQGDYPPRPLNTFIEGWRPDTTQAEWTRGRFWKRNAYDRNASQRAMLSDSRFWALNALPAHASGALMPQMVLRNDLGFDYNGPGQTYADLYRHGKYPSVDRDLYSTQGGKIGYNILYADGHVVTSSDWRDVFRAIRMRFPG